MTSSRPLYGWDLATWRLAESDPSLRSTMVGVLEISGRIDLAVVLTRAATATALLPRLRSCLHVSDGQPSVSVLPEVDVRTRIRALPMHADIASAVATAIRTPFELGEPLWRLRVLQRGNTTWVIGAMHHAIADGGGAFSLMTMLFDGMAGRARAPHADSQSATAAATDGMQKLLSRLLSDPLGLVADSVRLLKSAAEVMDAGDAPASPALSGRSDQFGVAWIALDLQGVDRADRRGLHHALVAAGVAAIAEVAAQRGEPTQHVNVNVPVATSSDTHNQVLVARLQLPVADPAEVVAESRHQLKRWREQPALRLAEELAQFAGSLPGELVAESVKRADITISTMPPLPNSFQVDGHAVTAVYPMAPPIGAAASVTSLPFGDRMLIGTSFDRAALNEDWPQMLADALQSVVKLPALVLTVGR